MAKKFFKCKVCGDIHFGLKGPHICPTCANVDTYAEISADDAKKAFKF
jgi:rubrerythrin